MKKSLIIILLVMVCACSTSEEEVETETTRFEQLFPEFPDRQFRAFELGDDKTTFQENLKNDAFNLKDGQQNHFVNTELEAELVLPELGGSNEFKVFLFAEVDLTSIEEYKLLLAEESTSQSMSADFSIFEFETQKSDFTISIFEQSDFVRLHFELKTSH